MFCEKCGKEIDNNAVICVHCKHQIVPIKKGSSNKIILIVLIPIVLLSSFVIIGILAALAIPKFLGATDKAKTAECRVVMKQLVTLQNAYNSYYNEYVDGSDAEWKEKIGFSDVGGTSRFVYRVTSSPDSIAIATFKESVGGVAAGTKVWMNSDSGIFTSSPIAQKMLGGSCSIANE